jgi:hypothetical protein
MLHLKFENQLSQEVSLSIFDVVGRKVNQVNCCVATNQIDINLSALPAGIYTCQILNYWTL